MSTGDLGQFTCEFCGKPYPWRAQYAGKKVRCACGEVMVAPAQPPAAPQAIEQDDGEYDLKDEPAPPKKPAMPMAGRPPVTPAGADNDGELDLAPAPAPVAAARPRPASNPAPTNPMLAYQSTAKPRDQQAARGDFANQIGGEPWRELWLPTGMCIVGLILNVLLFLHTSDGAATIGSIMPRLGLTLLLNLVLSAVGILAVSRLMEISFGHPGTAIIKLIAAILVPGALAGFAGNWIGHDSLFVNVMVRLTLIVPLTEIALVVLFQIALDEAMYCVMVIYLVTDWATKFIVGMLLGGPLVGGAALMQSADLQDAADGPKSQTPWVLKEIAASNTQDAATYLQPGDRTLGKLPPAQAVQIVQSFKDAGATQVLLHLPYSYRAYKVFIGLPDDAKKRDAVIALYNKTCTQLRSTPMDVLPADKFLILNVYSGVIDDIYPVRADGSPDTRSAEDRARDRQQQPQ